MGRSILLADDSPTIRKIVELTFSETDIRIHAVGTGSEALDLLQGLRPDLVLADVVMPEPAGYEVCRAVKASADPVPVLLLAGTFEPFDEELARQCGADGHLVKPFESRTLRRRVEALLDPPKPEPERPAAPETTTEQVAEERDEPDEVEPDTPDIEAPVASQPVVEDPRSPGIDVDPALVEVIAREVVRRLSDKVVREIAWDVIPDVATRIIRERIRELEREDQDDD